MNGVYFALMGFLGALLYVLVWSKRWRDLICFRSFVVGLVAGYVYHLFSDNVVMAVAVGWVCADFVESLLDRWVEALFRKPLN